jgi:hypothetical protein
MLSHLIEKKGEFELKYTFPNFLSPTLESWLITSCRKDKKYPESKVQSIYLETLNSDSYQEKVNSDFFKTKYRVRWYETPDLTDSNNGDHYPIFLEKKMKVGAKRLKHRWAIRSNFKALRLKKLSSKFHQNWHDLIAEKEAIPYLCPLIQISYTRKRFIDSFSGARFSLDYNIRVEKTNSLMLPPPQPEPLETSVFEVKSNSETPPFSIQYLVQNLAKKNTFSKYERCVSCLNI